ncbi:MAG: lysozyme inhibitor LprI family protein, partial [Terricaulis sp.]
MRVAVVLAAFILVLVDTLPASAQEQPDRPQAAYAGQQIDDITCDPDGSTLTMAVCFQLWLSHEEELLQQSTDRLLAYALEQERPSRLYQGDQGYVGSITRGQNSWLAWRDDECAFATIDTVSGSIRRLEYPNCLARLTAQRRGQLDAVLVRWRADELGGVVCVLHADV